MKILQQQGISLIELMIAMVAGLIVGGAVLAFATSSLQANTQYVSATRLTQELRSMMDETARDLRRAGFDQAFIDQLGRQSGSTTVSAFTPMLVGGTATSRCIIYAYDRAPFNATTLAGAINLANGEVRGIRRTTTTIGSVQVGVLEVAQSASGRAAPACDQDSATYSTYPASCNGNWCPISDPRLVNVLEFSAALTNSDVAAASTSSFGLRIRDFDLNIRASLRNDTTVERAVRTTVRVRADCIRSNLADCALAPVGS